MVHSIKEFLNDLRTDFNAAPTCYRDSAGGFDTSLSCPASVDVAVVGGGLLGLSTALEIATAGRTVAVLEAGTIGSGQSMRSGGQLWPGFEISLSALVEMFGETTAADAWRRVHDALGTVHRRAATAGGCEFRPGLLVVSKSDSQARWIEKEARLLERLGIGWGAYVGTGDLRAKHINSPLYTSALYFRGDDTGPQYGHLNPRSFTSAVARLAGAAGAILCEQCRVTGLNREPAGGYRLQTNSGSVKAAQVVIATGIGGIRGAGLPRAFVPVQTLILCTRPISAELAGELIPGGACFCDASGIAMNYGRLIEAGDGSGRFRVAFGGADALAQFQLALNVVRIRREIGAVFPQLAGIEVESAWGGQCDLSRSGVPMLLTPEAGLYCAAGFSGQGMVTTTLYASAIAQAVTGRSREGLQTLAALNPAPYARSGPVAKGQAAFAAFRSALSG
ncbi:FAD-binding oxidoreductase [Paraburkholderia sp. MMS20-SJTN17]|uniref:FAD-binding oxidoreductase n=1 Tax=Paraburkholderia translucens TaxID=2886945 RepID=A0ABS8KER4_9BURK|nr:FAD-binding oxidoreductase [Paraburkholderia sp. MMS20-SJTN17]MCC8403254.1 FAD-binding oxidoreductase [Paraburkholderia sp. MMS20-SJTN17]